MPAHPLSAERRAALKAALQAGESIQKINRRLHICPNTVRFYAANPDRLDAAPVKAMPSRATKAATSLPAAKHEAKEEPSLPDARPESYDSLRIDAPGRWLVISDIHAPYHDRKTIELAVSEAHRRGIVGVLLNGDTLDSHEISNHDKDPTAPRYIEEIEVGRKLLGWVRGQFPKARLVLKEGNHEERLNRYIIQRAPALFGLEGIDLHSLLHLKDVGAEWVGEKRVIKLGKLCVVHGHEYRGGGGVMPARWLYLRTRYVSMCGHFHRTSEHGERNINSTEERSWSTGCACYLFPKYMPLNSWNHGFAFVDVGRDGSFAVENKRVFDGQVV